MLNQRLKLPHIDKQRKTFKTQGRFVCDIALCTSSYTTQSSLTRHINDKHCIDETRMPRVECPYCGAVFTGRAASAWHLERHVVSHCPKRSGMWGHFARISHRHFTVYHTVSHTHSHSTLIARGHPHKHKHTRTRAITVTSTHARRDVATVGRVCLHRNRLFKGVQVPRQPPQTPCFPCRTPHL